MKGFIEVTRIIEDEFHHGYFNELKRIKTESKISLSVSRIIQIEPFGDMCILVVFYSMTENVSSFNTKESYEEIKELIKQAQ